VIILASTGKAVIDIAAPKNKAKGIKLTLLLETRGYSKKDNKKAEAKGTIILKLEIKTAVFKLPLRYLGFNSKPIKNMKNISPICDKTFRKGIVSGGNILAAKLGAINPNNDGPSIIPAQISPITNGCLIALNPNPTIREMPMTINTSTRTRITVCIISSLTIIPVD
jgi:hypothetical protein